MSEHPKIETVEDLDRFAYSTMPPGISADERDGMLRAVFEPILGRPLVRGESIQDVFAEARRVLLRRAMG